MKLPRVLIHLVSSGGRSTRTVNWATVLGVGRSDVTRVAVRLANGRERELQLNEWRGFGYVATRREDFPAELIAYGEQRRLFGSEEVVLEATMLERTTLGPFTPLCGGEAGPCDPELERLAKQAERRRQGR